MNVKPIAEIIFDLVFEYKFSILNCLKVSELGINRVQVKCLLFVRNNEICTTNDMTVYFSRDKAQVVFYLRK